MMSDLLIFKPGRIGGTCMVICQYIVGIIGVTAGRTNLHNNSATSAMIAFICLNIAS